MCGGNAGALVCWATQYMDSVDEGEVFYRVRQEEYPTPKECSAGSGVGR